MIKFFTTMIFTIATVISCSNETSELSIPAHQTSSGPQHFSPILPNDELPQLISPLKMNASEYGDLISLYDRGIEGSVTLKLSISKEGILDNVTVAQSSNHQGLDELALKVVRKSTFIPAKRNGELVNVSLHVPWEIAIPPNYKSSKALGKK